MAKGFNAKLGPVYSIRYHVANYQPMPVARMYKSAGAAAESDAAQTYEQQSIHFDDQVDVVFELQRNAAQ
ncbi:oxidative stress defense protein [compost metagenome]